MFCPVVNVIVSGVYNGNVALVALVLYSVEYFGLEGKLLLCKQSFVGEP